MFQTVDSADKRKQKDLYKSLNLDSFRRKKKRVRRASLNLKLNPMYSLTAEQFYVKNKAKRNKSGRKSRNQSRGKNS